MGLDLQQNHQNNSYDLKGKRLLLLGGSMWKETIRQFADETGIVLIACGNNSNAGIFEICDESYIVNSVDSEAMKILIKEKKIDGVYLGGSEPVISAACEYVNELGLPCYCNKEQWEALANKAQLKELYKMYDIPTTKRYLVNENNIDTTDVVFPVITKPVDGSGSNGFSICRNKEDLINGYYRAKENSFSGDVLVEEYVPNNSIVVVGRMMQGEYKICCIEDKYPVFYSEHSTFVAGMHLFESKRKEEFISLYEEKINKMLKSLGIQEGPIWFEVFVDGDRYCFNEAGFRYSGSITIWPVQYFASINEVAEDITYALTGKSDASSYRGIIPSNKINKKHYCIYSLHLHAGKINSIEGVEKLLSNPNVIAVPTAKNVGNEIKSTGSIGQVYGFVHFTYDTNEELIEFIEEIHSTLQILDENGQNMLNRKIDFNNLTIR